MMLVLAAAAAAAAAVAAGCCSCWQGGRCWRRTQVKAAVKRAQQCLGPGCRWQMMLAASLQLSLTNNRAAIARGKQQLGAVAGQDDVMASV